MLVVTRLIYPDKILFKIAEEIVTALGRHQTVTLPMGNAINAYKIAIAGIPSNQNVTMECASKVWLILNLVVTSSHSHCIIDFLFAEDLCGDSFKGGDLSLSIITLHK